MKKKVIITIALVFVLIGVIAATKHTISPYEAALKDGTIWQYSTYVADLGAAGATDAYLLKTPATGKYHVAWELNAGGGVYMQVYENPTINATQTESTTYCKNRIKDTSTSMQIWADGCFTLGSAGSAVIRTVMIGSAYTLAGGAGSSSTGWWLEQGEEYYILLTAIAANPGYTLTLQWHSH